MARFAGPDEAFGYFEAFTNFERRRLTPEDREYRLDRMFALLEHFGRPHEGPSFFHVAGTKGKGSTAAYLASALQAAGHRTGLYLSPHVSSYNERISIDGAPVPASLLTGLASWIADEMDTGALEDLRGGFGPTTFELLTLLALLCFRAAGCREAVIEVGIGGRLDATNVIIPATSVITPLDLEHTQLLGDTLASIAREKAGIIKPGRPVFVGYQQQEAREVFAAIAAERGAALQFLADRVVSLEARVGRTGTSIDITLADDEPRSFHLAMLGRFQAENAALAWLALRGTRPDVPFTAVQTGFARARLPGRMEIAAIDPPLVLDAAHTPLATDRLLETFRELFPQPGVLVFGSVAGKRPADMARILAPAFPHVIVTTPGTFKESDPRETWELFHALRPATELEPDPARALARALELSGGTRPILVTGSFYLLGEIRRALSARDPSSAPAVL
jgi:dihydrofolate synthase / folylpolyglutamate synthase